MIAGSSFTSVFGLVPAGDPDRLARIARAACQQGWAVVVCAPGRKVPLCTLTARGAKTADRAAQQAAQAAGDLHAGRRRHDCGLSHAITDPDQAMRIVTRLVGQAGHCNLGLELGASRLLCVDVDTAQQNAAFLVAWSAATGLDETGRRPTVRSPGAVDSAGRVVHSDGGHYWFALPDGLTLPAEPGVLHGEGDWSLMWARRQVLIPPSVRAEGAYELVGLGEMAPAWLIERIFAEVEARGQRATSQRDRAFSSDDPLERWSAAVGWPGVLPMHGWTDTGLIDGCGCPVWTAPGDHASPKSATAHEAGCARYNTQTGWGPLHLWTDQPPDELRGQRTWTKLSFLAAMEYGGDVREAMRDLEINATPQVEGGAESIEGIIEDAKEQMHDVTAETDLLAGLRTGQWLDGQTFPVLRYAVPGILPEGAVLLVGPPKIGKSWFVLSAGLAIASGGAMLGQSTGDPRSVLLLALEDGDRRLQDRCRKLLGDVPIPGRFTYLTRVDAAVLVATVMLWLERHGGDAPLVVLDTLGKIMPPAKPGESSYQRDYRIASLLKRIADDHPGMTLLINHHDRKATSEDFVDSVSGTHGLAGAADTIVTLTRKRTEEAGILRVTGRDVAEGQYALTLSGGSRWGLDGVDLAEAAQRATNREVTQNLGDRSQMVVTALSGFPEGASVTQVSQATGLEERLCRTYLGRLADAGRIERWARGLYGFRRLPF